MATAHVLTGLFRPRTALGVAVGLTAVRGLRLARGDRGPIVEETAESLFPSDRPPSPTEIGAAVKTVVDALADDKTCLVVGLDARTAGLHFFSPPFDRADKVHRVLRYEAEPLFLTPVDRMVLDYMPLDPIGDERRGVVFGAETDAVAALLGLLHEADVDPDAVLPERLALLLAGRRLFPDEDHPPCLLVDLGAGQTSLAFFHRRNPVLVRTVFYGGRNMTLALAEADGLSLFDAESMKRGAALDAPGPPRALTDAWQPLLQEMDATLTDIARNTDEDRFSPVIVLGGGGAVAPGIQAFLSDRLDVPVQRLEPETFDPPGLPGVAGEYLSAFGLALAGLAPGRRPNLRQGDLAPRNILSRYRGALALTVAGLVLSALLGLGDLVYQYKIEAGKNSEAKARIQQLFKETAPHVTRIVDPLAQMRQEIEKARTSAGMGPGGGRVLDLLIGVNRLASAHHGLRITDLTLNPQRIDLKGEGGSFETIDRLKTELSGLPGIGEATVGGARMDPNTRVLTFTISLRRTQG